MYAGSDRGGDSIGSSRGKESCCCLWQQQPHPHPLPTWNMMLAKRKVGANWPTMDGDLSLGWGNSARPTSQLRGRASNRGGMGEMDSRPRGRGVSGWAIG